MKTKIAQPPKPCQQCGTIFTPYRSTSHHCSASCKKLANENKVNVRRLEASRKRYPDGTDTYHYVECKICGYRAHHLSSHPKIHGLTQEEYTEKYGTVVSQATADSVKGDKNPAYQHGGKFSPFSEKYIHYQGQEYIDELLDKGRATRIENCSSDTKLDYYTSRGATLEEAEQLLSERQTTFSLEKCIAKYGEEAGRLRWQERQDKWLTNYKKMNYSKVSQELFNSIMESYCGDVYYATYSRSDVDDRDNKEYKLQLADGGFIMPDFISINNKKIIEFDGDYWHRENTANPSRESNRDARVVATGYDILHIKECDFRKNKQETIQKCLNFLTQ